MKQLPYTLVETAVNALQFCIVTRSRLDASRAPVICCSPSISTNQYGVVNMALNMCGINNDVIGDAMRTVAAITLTRKRFNIDFPLIDSSSFKYTAQQYAVALQNLFAALPDLTSDEKE